jgi:hypothetical protein
MRFRSENDSLGIGIGLMLAYNLEETNIRQY